jgi:putative NADH-flavin reductase
MIDLRDQDVAAEVEKKILQEIAERRRQIAAIEHEIDTYQRMLMKSRQQQVLIKQTDVTRKNSINRILVENAVVNTLKSSGRPRKTSSLYRDAVLIVGSLKEGTFRTILHRMKNRGIITSVSDGKWQIGASALIPRTEPEQS